MKRIHEIKPQSKMAHALLVTLMLLIAAVVLIFLGRHEKRQTALDLQTALRRQAIACYAIEGRYPRTADELLTRYGIVYDDSRYVVVYESPADNRLPLIRVIPRGSAAAGGVP